MSNVIDIRTRLPHGHLAGKAADIAHQARVLARVAGDLRQAMTRFEEMGAKVAQELRALA